MRTVATWLRENFGDSADAIDGINDHWVSNNVFSKASFCATKGTSDLQITCGGDCLVAFDDVNGVGMQGTVFLIRDDSKGQAWDANRSAHLDAHRPRPFAKLRLVMSI